MSTWLLLMAMLAALLHAPTVHAQNSSLPTAWPDEVKAALQDAGIPLEASSFWVAPAEQGEPVFAHLPQQMRPIASVMKVFTTGAALHNLGPAWTWQTSVGLDSPPDEQGRSHGALYLRGSGDPSLNIEQVQAMMARWYAAGLHHIEGDFVLDRQAFKIPAHDPFAFDGEGLRPYNAGPDALLINQNSVHLHFTPSTDLINKVRVIMTPTLAKVSVNANVQIDDTLPCGDWRDYIQIQIGLVAGATTQGLSPWQIQVSGRYPRACETQSWPLLWPSSGQFAARLLTQTWTQTGGTLKGQIRDGQWPTHITPWQSWASAPLPIVIRDINKFSNNVMARQLFLAQSRKMPATPDNAMSVVSQTVRTLTAHSSAFPCDDANLIIDNGSGLSRREASTAACLGAWLQAMWRSPHMADFVSSLPITGIDGTTRRWQGAQGFGRIKTGSLTGVRTMAGYVDAFNGQRYAVVGLIQHPHANATRPVFEALLHWIRHKQ